MREGRSGASGAYRPEIDGLRGVAVVAVIPGGNFVDPLAAIADAQGRVPLVTPEGKLISQDGIHLTPSGAQWLGRIVFEQPPLAHLVKRAPQS